MAATAAVVTAAEIKHQRLAIEFFDIFDNLGLCGKVQEWLNWQHWKCCELERVPWVRIPPFPPEVKAKG